MSGSWYGDYRDTFNAVNLKGSRRSLPPVLTLFAAAVLLKALDDPLAVGAGLDDADGLRVLQDLVAARNRSVLAHGEESVSVALSEELNNKAVEVLTTYWHLQYPDEDLDRSRAQLAFVRAATQRS
jgi:hypothetical protein